MLLKTTLLRIPYGRNLRLRPCHRSLSLQTIDLTEDIESIASKLKEACRETGVFYVKTRKGFLQSSSIFDETRRFFALKQNEKDSFAPPSSAPPGFIRGYLGLGAESGGDHLEVKEAFSYGYEWEKSRSSFSNKLEGHNIWPSRTDTNSEDGFNAERFRSSANALFNDMTETSVVLSQGKRC
jgi:isopenicillin N synthase-like dioxygenase